MPQLCTLVGSGGVRGGRSGPGDPFRDPLHRPGRTAPAGHAGAQTPLLRGALRGLLPGDPSARPASYRILAGNDQAGPGTLDDMILPVMDDLTLEFKDGTTAINITTNDRDSSEALRTVAWSIVNGPFTILNSSSRVGESNFTITIPENLIGTDHLNSLIVNITSESYTLFLPLILLSTQIGSHLIFTTATLDHEIVRVGFLLNDLITGELVLEGFALASIVYIAFHSESGSWHNFTLTSSTGIYNFEISPSYFQLGNHEVYAIAIVQSVPGAEMNFATLTVVQDYTVVVIGAALVLLVCGIVVIQRRRRGDMV